MRHGQEFAIKSAIGDYVEDTFTNTGLGSASIMSASFNIENLLGGLSDDMVVNIFVDGVLF